MNGQAGREPASRPELALARLEEAGFYAGLQSASGHRSLAEALERTPELRLLAARAGEALPLLLSRLERPGAPPSAETRIACYVLFGAAGDGRALRHLADWIEGLPASEMPAALSPWHPFGHAARAIERLAGGAGSGAGEPPVDEALFERRSDLAARAREAAARR